MNNETATDSSSRFALTFAFLILGISLAFYVPLITNEPLGTVYLSLLFLLPRVCAHIGILILLTLFFKKNPQPAFIFWGISLVILLILGGTLRMLGFAAIVLLAFCFIEIGAIMTKLFFSDDLQSLGISLSFGILFTSIIGAYLAWFHFFRFWILCPLFFLFTSVALFKNKGVTFSHLRMLKHQLSANWNFCTALVLEALFLIGAYVLVDASTPDNLSDSVRVYWPYVKLLAKHFGFFENPYQWSYVIPQSGSTYAASVFIFLGPFAVRWSMFLCWLAILGIVIRGKLSFDLDIRIGVALLLLSCPILLRLSSTLMQDTYVCVITLVLAIVCVEAKNPRSAKFWFAIGILTGMAWTSKFSTLFFSIPFAFYALYRAFKADGNFRIFTNLIVTIAGAVLGSAPWLWHTYNQTGNPFFPLFANFQPSNFWPNPADLLNLTDFRFSRGWGSWILWPYDLTFHTNQFVEAYAGALGLVLIFLLVFLVPTFLKMKPSNKAFVICAVVATAMMWTKTCYIRYWLPSLCLVAVAILPEIIKLIGKSDRWRIRFCLLSVIICFAQVPYEMLSLGDPSGWSYDHYFRHISEETYLDRTFPGILRFRNVLTSSQESFPRIWFTAYDGAGHLNVEPMEATIWEMRRHGLVAPRSWIHYLLSTGCKYWIVNKDGDQAHWFQVLGLSRFLWLKENEVAAQGQIRMYKMTSLESAMMLFDNRARAGSDLLLNGELRLEDFSSDEHWILVNRANWIKSKDSKATVGDLLLLPPSSGVRQHIPLPQRLKEIALASRVKTGSTNKGTSFMLSINWQDENMDSFASIEKTFDAKENWNEETITVAVPAGAVWAEFSIHHTNGDSHLLVDELHMFSK